MPTPLWALDPVSQKRIAEDEIEFLLDEISDRGRPIDDWEKSALVDGIAAVVRGQYGLAIACADLADTPPERRSPQSPPPPVEHRRATPRDLRRWLAYAKACPLPPHLVPYA
jgi:hypothetical protein